MKNMIAIDNNQLLKEAVKIQEYGLNGFDSMFLVDVESGVKCKTILKHHVKQFTSKNKNYVCITSIDKDNQDIKNIVSKLSWSLNKYCGNR